MAQLFGLMADFGGLEYAISLISLALVPLASQSNPQYGVEILP